MSSEEKSVESIFPSQLSIAVKQVWVIIVFIITSTAFIVREYYSLSSKIEIVKMYQENTTKNINQLEADYIKLNDRFIDILQKQKDIEEED